MADWRFILVADGAELIGATSYPTEAAAAVALEDVPAAGHGAGVIDVDAPAAEQLTKTQRSALRFLADVRADDPRWRPKVDAYLAVLGFHEARTGRTVITEKWQ